MERKRTKQAGVKDATNGLGHWAEDLILDQAALEGYRSVENPEEPSLFEFVCDHLTGPYQHPFGEVITKLVRFTKRQDPEDLAKAVAWIVLVYRHHINKGGQ